MVSELGLQDEEWPTLSNGARSLHCGTNVLMVSTFLSPPQALGNFFSQKPSHPVHDRHRKIRTLCAMWSGRASRGKEVFAEAMCMNESVESIKVEWTNFMR
jgi:hypothetical protein